MADYTPINCDYYDFLEHLATLRLPAEILFRMPGGEEQVKTAVIKDFQARKGVEYMILDNQFEIRLDWLISVNGQLLPGFC